MSLATLLGKKKPKTQKQPSRKLLGGDCLDDPDLRIPDYGQINRQREQQSIPQNRGFVPANNNNGTAGGGPAPTSFRGPPPPRPPPPQQQLQQQQQQQYPSYQHQQLQQRARPAPPPPPPPPANFSGGTLNRTPPVSDNRQGATTNLSRWERIGARRHEQQQQQQQPPPPPPPPPSQQQQAQQYGTIPVRYQLYDRPCTTSTTNTSRPSTAGSTTSVRSISRRVGEGASIPLLSDQQDGGFGDLDAADKFLKARNQEKQSNSRR